LLSGLVLGLSGPPFFQPWLVLICWVPLAWIALGPGMEWRRTTAATAMFGLGQNLVLAAVLEFPLQFALPLALALTVSWAALGLLIGLLLPRLAPPWALAVIPAAAVAVDQFGLMAIPVFGTAQSFVRALAHWPWTLAIGAYAGHGGVVLLVSAAQTGLAAALLRARPARGLAAAGLVVAAASAAVMVGAWAARATSGAARAVPVAAVGWTSAAEGDPATRSGSPAEQVDSLLAPLVRRAARAGARLVVAPEVAFFADSRERQPLLDRLAALARETSVVLVVGYFDVGGATNQAVVVGPDGELRGEYRKTHLIPGIEHYTAGAGDLVVVTGDDVPGPLGVMICQDDNFTDLSRAYGRRGVRVLAVPTNDWQAVQEFHLQNALLRTVESGFAMVRGASNGISAVIDSRGRVVARRDHHAEGTGIVVADLTLTEGGTIYSGLGDWISFACAAFLVVAAARATRRRRSPRDRTA
jgi:apolipoprotein N-acyltransferase